MSSFFVIYAGLVGASPAGEEEVVAEVTAVPADSKAGYVERRRRGYRPRRSNSFFRTLNSRREDSLWDSSLPQEEKEAKVEEVRQYQALPKIPTTYLSRLPKPKPVIPSKRPKRRPEDKLPRGGVRLPLEQFIRPKAFRKAVIAAKTLLPRTRTATKVAPPPKPKPVLTDEEAVTVLMMLDMVGELD